ncbi:cation:proton antiporter (plasmid) [Haladaptatus sp. SPP-AMP-3]|uniref:cation:proton antiporter domain-containing protein n=1 Tax=Haladaptatus sp. SPP-AMP-3 TaxID=3121295 RepID=UPI003C2B87E0
MASELLLVAALVIGLGVASKLIGDRYSIPSVVFLLGAGILFGPEGFGLIDPQLFGGSLSTLVSLSVAIIVFEGAFNLDVDTLRQAPASTLRLVTIGSAITLVGLGVAIHIFLGLQWSLSLVISALLVATGPTVITPILDQVDVRENVRAILEIEGIVNDVVAAVLAAVLFEVVALGHGFPLVGGSVQQSVLTEFLSRIGLGVIVGTAIAALSAYVLRYLSESPQHSRITALATALLSFAIADSLASEAGIVSVAVAGILLGNANIPYHEAVSEFKDDITVVVLGVVYLLLAALLTIEDLFALGIGGLAVVLVTAYIVRPLGVWLATRRASFTPNERLFISFVGPRGIVPASVATLFSLELAAEGVPNASSVVSVVFLVILVTVVVQAGSARFLAERLDIIPMKILIIGGGRTGRTLADRLEQRGENPVIVERDDATVAELRRDGYSVVHGNGTKAAILKEAGIENATKVAATTGSDDQNILTCQTARTRFGVDDLVAQVNDPENRDAFEDLGVRTVSPILATAYTMDNMMIRPGMFPWLSEFADDRDVSDVTVSDQAAIGTTIAELDLPEGCIVGLLKKNGERLVPMPDTTLERGDVVTLLGRVDAIDEARSHLTEVI